MIQPRAIASARTFHGSVCRSPRKIRQPPDGADTSLSRIVDGSPLDVQNGGPRWPGLHPSVSARRHTLSRPVLRGYTGDGVAASVRDYQVCRRLPSAARATREITLLGRRDAHEVEAARQRWPAASSAGDASPRCSPAPIAPGPTAAATRRPSRPAPDRLRRPSGCHRRRPSRSSPLSVSTRRGCAPASTSSAPATAWRPQRLSGSRAARSQSAASAPTTSSSSIRPVATATSEGVDANIGPRSTISTTSRVAAALPCRAGSGGSRAHVAGSPPAGTPRHDCTAASRLGLFWFRSGGFESLLPLQIAETAGPARPAVFVSGPRRSPRPATLATSHASPNPPPTRCGDGGAAAQRLVRWIQIHLTPCIGAGSEIVSCAMNPR
jgi:hypothetical protein